VGRSTRSLARYVDSGWIRSTATSTSASTSADGSLRFFARCPPKSPREWFASRSPVAAIGIPSAGALGTTLDAAYFAVGVDARLRVRLGRTPWPLVGLELGAALAGIDARADARRVTAQLGARVALLLGLAWAL